MHSPHTPMSAMNRELSMSRALDRLPCLLEDDEAVLHYFESLRWPPCAQGHRHSGRRMASCRRRCARNTGANGTPSRGRKSRLEPLRRSNTALGTLLTAAACWPTYRVSPVDIFFSSKLPKHGLEISHENQGSGRAGLVLWHGHRFGRFRHGLALGASGLGSGAEVADPVQCCFVGLINKGVSSCPVAASFSLP
jgi:hypothetical protein